MLSAPLRLIAVFLLAAIVAACVPSPGGESTPVERTGTPTRQALPSPAPSASPSLVQEPTPALTRSATPPTTPPVTATDTPAIVYTPADHVGTIQSSGQTRHYRLHVPPGCRSAEPLSLVINLHGLGSSMGQQALLSRASDKADAEGFVVVYPQGSDVPRMWHSEPSPAGREDVQFIRDLVDHLKQSLSINPRQIDATGFSNGGGMAHRLACDLPDVIAAIGPVSGAYLLDQACDPDRPVPVVAFHGTADPVVPYEGQSRGLPAVRDWAARWAARNGCDPTPEVTQEQDHVIAEAWGNCDEGADVVLYTIQGGGHTWPQAGVTDAIWSFFERHPRSNQ